MDIQKKKIIVFDLDGTLTETKSPMDAEMAELVAKLLEQKMVAIISGGAFEQFERQLPALKSLQPVPDFTAIVVAGNKSMPMR